MANSARIDELEKKFGENARRYFAPLANEYRKAGDLDRAIEICRAHLPQQPGHMSGHVVYGQALYESRQLDEAKTVFEAALALDPENLIALRHLGDIARDSGDPSTARAWYLRVLDADPRNDEVAGMLAELDAAAQQATTQTPPPAPAGDSVGWGDINPERPASGVAASSETPAGADASVESDVDEEEEERTPQASGTEAAPAGEPSESPEAALFTPEVPAPKAESLDQMLNEAFAADADTQEMEVARPARDRGPSRDERPEDRGPADADADAFAEVDALFDEISPPRPGTGSQRSVTGAQPTQDRPAPKQPPRDPSGDALFGDDATPEPGETSAVSGLETSEFVSPPRPAPSAPRRDTGSMAVTGLTSFDQPTDEDSSTRAAFVTETMAELYLQQGFTAEALDIYRQLLAKDPDDESLRDRVAQLERGGRTSLSVAAVSSEVIEAAKQRHATRQVRTVRSFFGLLAGRRAPHRGSSEEAQNGSEAGEPEGNQPPGYATEADVPVAPERLDLVGGLFGEAPVSEDDERAASTLASAFPRGASSASDRRGEPSASAPTSLPGPSGRAAHSGGSELSLDQVFRDTASRNPRKSGAYSFDQFFSDGTPTSAGGGQTGAASPADAPEGPEGDLEQFTAWLEGLKRK